MRFTRKIRSQAQIEASRRNGARSRGPKTPPGKARVAENPITHGLTSRAVILSNENPENFRQLLEELQAEWQPTTRSQLLVVEELAVATWRLRRSWTFESGLLDDQMDADLRDPLPPSERIRATRAWKKLHDKSTSLRGAISCSEALTRDCLRLRKHLLDLQNHQIARTPQVIDLKDTVDPGLFPGSKPEPSSNPNEYNDLELP